MNKDVPTKEAEDRKAVQIKKSPKIVIRRKRKEGQGVIPFA